MKKLKSILISAFILLTACILLVGCEGKPACPDETETTRYFPEKDKKIIPYTGYDTLYFMTSSNDTVKCIGLGKEVSFEEQFVKESNPDCNVYHKTNYEVNTTNYGLISIKQSYLDVYFNIYFNNNLNFKFTYIFIGKPVTTYHDSLLINNKYYYTVSEFPGENKDDKIFINRADGIVRIYDSNSQTTWNKL